MKRKTVQRKAIEEVFKQHDRPLGVGEIFQFGNKLAESLNQATVYRNLKLLVDSGWLTQVAYPALGTLYERAGKGHHHHFHCRMCNQMLELPGCALKESEIAPHGFVVEEHEVFLSGVCPSCVGR